MDQRGVITRLPTSGPAHRAAVTVRELDRALADGDVVALYQPVHDLRTGAVVAVEALARLRDRDTGLLRTPDQFIPVAERTGRAHRVDAAVAAVALPQAAAWRASGAAPLSVAVNVSPTALWDTALPSRLAAQARSAGLPLDSLIVEVTETALSEAGSGHEEVLADLAERGVNVTLDDFGTGFSSLSHLLRFPSILGVKVDRSFVAASGTPRGRAVLEAVHGIGRCLDLHVVAEGVEERGQLALLRALGVPFAQGFLFSRPLAPEALTAYLLRPPLRVPRARRPSG